MTSITSIIKRLLKPPVYSVERALYLSGVRRLGSLTLPNFLVLGSGQSGTSWLHTVLSDHPDICLPDKKETHYFSRALNKWSLAYYSSLFADSTAKCRGEITPGYNLLRQDRIRLIRRLMPDVRLVLIMRNPVERSWSEARRSLGKVAARKGKSLTDLDDSMFHDYFAKEWMSVPEYGGAFEYGLLQGQYARTIDNWLAVFPPEQLQVCFYQQIKDDPVEFLTSICNHIGADPGFKWDPEKIVSVVNRNPKCEMPEHFRKALEDRYAADIRELHRRFGEPVEDWLCP